MKRCAIGTRSLLVGIGASVAQWTGCSTIEARPEIARTTTAQRMNWSAAEVVAEQVRAYNARDLDWFVGMYSLDVVIENLATGAEVGRGRSFMLERYAHRFTSSPDLHATIRDRIEFGRFVVDHEEVVMKKGTPPSRAIAVYEVSDGLIRHVWFLFDEDAGVE